MTPSTQWRDLPLSGAPVYDEETDTLVRQSIVGQMLLCPKRVELDGQDGHLAMVSEPLAFGTCMHYLAEKDLEAGEPRLDLLTNMNEWIEEILIEQYEWSLDKVPNPRNFFEELAGAYRLWRTQVQPNLKGEMLGIEAEMQAYLGEGNSSAIHLQGTADVVFPTRLVDFKTSGRAWKQEKADVSIQASLYMALCKQVFDRKIQKFTFWCYDRSKREWTALETQRTVKQINSALLSAYEYGLQIEAGIFPATPVPESSFVKKRGWYCSPRFCGSWNLCPSKYLNDSVDESVVAIRSWN